VFWQSVERLKPTVTEFRAAISCELRTAAFGSTASTTVSLLWQRCIAGNPSRPDWMNTMDVRALNRCARVTCLSFSYREYLMDLGLGRISAG